MDARDKVIDRIRKLLALARSSNPHEAAMAAARAAELMAEHQLAASGLEVTGEPEPIGEHCLETARSRVTWKVALAAGVCRGFSCDCFHTRNRVDGRWQSQIMAVGRSSDVDTVKYMYAYLVRELDRLASLGWKQRVADGRLGESARSWKNAFRIGATIEIASRLQASRASALASARARADHATRQALVRIDEHAASLDAYMAGLRLRRSRTPVVSSITGLSRGKAAGKEVDLGRHPGLGRPARQLTR